MKTSRIMAVAVLIVGSGLALHVTLSQQPGIKRTDLQPHDLSVHRTRSGERGAPRILSKKGSR